MPNYDLRTYPQAQVDWVNYLLELIQQRDSSPQTWIDVGTNVGNISDCLIKQSLPHNDIWCFEPKASLYNFLVQKYIHCAQVTVHSKACTNITGEVEFHDDRKLDGAKSFIKGSVHQGKTSMDYEFNADDFDVVKVSAVRLDDMVTASTKPITFIKTDAETSDFLVLQGAEKIMKEHRPIVLTEFSGATGCRVHNYTPIEWYQFFKNLNYRLVSPINGHDEKYILKNFNSYAPDLMDVLAIPNEVQL